MSWIADTRNPGLVGFGADKPMRLPDFTGTLPTRAGASMGLMTGLRSESRTWARAFHGSWPEIDDLYYPSSPSITTLLVRLTTDVTRS